MTNEKIAAMTTVALQLSNVLNVTSGAHCEYKAMTVTDIVHLLPHIMHTDNNNYPLRVGREYMIIICPNGYRYYVDVTYDSPLTACAETISFAAKKL